MARSAAQAKSAGPVLLSIGQVLAKLTPEHPELTPSKLRFLEEQGLVSPARTPSGYRKFSAEDVERLKLVLSMQRDHYLPLKVIRDYLADLDAGLSPMPPGGSGGVAGAGRPARPNMLSTARRFTRDELLRESGASAQLLADAVSASLMVDPRVLPGHEREHPCGGAAADQNPEIHVKRGHGPHRMRLFDRFTAVAFPIR